LEREKINTGRQPEFDLAKVIAVFFMIIIHVADQMGTVMGTQGAFPVLLDLIGGPLAAPVFMFAMGVGMVYTRHDAPEEFAKRGLRLLLAGYVLNFFRETILILIAHVCAVETTYDKSIIDTIGTVDILQFAGMTFLLVALLKRIGAGPAAIFAAAVIMQAAGSLANGMFDSMPKAAQYLLGLLFFTNDAVSFPALLWFIYPAAGIVFGNMLQRVKDKDAFYAKVMLAGVIAFAAVTAATIAAKLDLLSYFTGADYYGQNLFSSMWILSIVLVFMGICYAVSNRIPEQAAERIKIISAQVNTIYIIQWLLITYVIAVKELIGAGHVADAWVVPVGILMAVASILLAEVYTGIFKKKKMNRTR